MYDGDADSVLSTDRAADMLGVLWPEWADEQAQSGLALLGSAQLNHTCRMLECNERGLRLRAVPKVPSRH